MESVSIFYQVFILKIVQEGAGQHKHFYINNENDGFGSEGNWVDQLEGQWINVQCL